MAVTVPSSLVSSSKRHLFYYRTGTGYETGVGPHGCELSSDKRQRLAISRALIRDPGVLLFDEATYALDANTENEIHAAIAAASSGRTTIMRGHRLATVQHGDRIFVFEEGQIVEKGRHDNLVELGGIYAGMVAAQELN